MKTEYCLFSTTSISRGNSKSNTHYTTCVNLNGEKIELRTGLLEGINGLIVCKRSKCVFPENAYTDWELVGDPKKLRRIIEDKLRKNDDPNFLIWVANNI